MIYVYDILLNFNKELIEYFEWENYDNIKYAKKIILFKIDKKTMNDILNYDIEFDSSFINNTNKYDLDGLNNKISYALFTDGDIVLGVSFKNNKLYLLSRLIIDEEDEIINISEKLDNYKINYKKLNLRKKDNRCLTRDEKYKLSIIKEEIDKLYHNKNLEKLKYLYYEFTSKSCDNINYIYKYLIYSLSSYTDKHKRILDVLNMSSKKL